MAGSGVNIRFPGKSQKDNRKNIQKKKRDMEMKEVYSNDRYKVLSVTLNLGEAMPLHHATSDAFIIGKKGKGKISFADRQITLSQGDTYLIKANEPHKMDILEDFSSCIILEAGARIDFNEINTFK